MSVKHTPGPWVWVKMDKDDTYYPGVFTGLMAGDVTVLTAEQHYADMCWVQVSEANGRLIAAAPELLWALKYVRDAVGHDGICLGKPYDCSACTMDKAIAKAEGPKECP